MWHLGMIVYGYRGFCQPEYLGFRDQLLFSRWSKTHLAAEWALVFHGWCKASGGLKCLDCRYTCFVINMNTLQKEGKRNPGKEITGGTEEAVKLSRG